MASAILPIVNTALRLGELTLQSATPENVFYQGEVHGRENYPDEYSMGIDTAAQRIPAGERLAGYTISDITEAGGLHELNKTDFVGTRPWPYIQAHPSLLVERPSFMPVDIDVRDNTVVLAQFTDTATAIHVLQYRVNIYIEYEEI